MSDEETIDPQLARMAGVILNQDLKITGLEDEVLTLLRSNNDNRATIAHLRGIIEEARAQCLETIRVDERMPLDEYRVEEAEIILAILANSRTNTTKEGEKQ